MKMHRPDPSVASAPLQSGHRFDLGAYSFPPRPSGLTRVNPNQAIAKNGSGRSSSLHRVWRARSDACRICRDGQGLRRVHP